MKLSICIPTLNRADTIGETLRSIAEQGQDVEVVIVDGASTDNTEAIVREWQKRIPRLIYHRGERNMGVERDTARTVEMASGEYCWLFTSDDVIKPGAIARLVAAVESQPELVVVNAEVRSRDLRERIDGSALRTKVDRAYSPEEFDQLFADTVSYLSYMGGVVIKRSLWNERDRAPYLDSDFVHLGVIFQRRLSGPTLVMPEPSIEIRYDNATWSTRAFHIWTFKWPAIVWSFQEVAPWAKAQVCRREGWRDLKRLMLQRASGTYTMEEYRRHIAPLEVPTVAKVPALLTALTPGILLNLVGLAYARVFRGGVTLHNLQRSRFHWSRAFSRAVS